MQKRLVGEFTSVHTKTNNKMTDNTTDITMLKQMQIMLGEDALRLEKDVKDLKAVVGMLVGMVMQSDPKLKAAIEKAKADCECEDCKPETAAPAVPTKTL